MKLHYPCCVSVFAVYFVMNVVVDIASTQSLRGTQGHKGILNFQLFAFPFFNIKMNVIQ